MSLIENTTNLSEVLEKVRALPEAGSGGSLGKVLLGEVTLNSTNITANSSGPGVFDLNSDLSGTMFNILNNINPAGDVIVLEFYYSAMDVTQTQTVATFEAYGGSVRGIIFGDDTNGVLWIYPSNVSTSGSYSNYLNGVISNGDTFTLKFYKLIGGSGSGQLSPSNNNLLINSNFARPVNQRSFSQDSANTVGYFAYTIDRWYVWRGDTDSCTSLTLGDGYLTLSGTKSNGDGLAYITQNLEKLPHGTYTLSAKINGEVYSATMDYSGDSTYVFLDDKVVLGVGGFTDSDVAFAWFGIYLDTLPSANIEWVKLEAGSFATPYVAKNYWEEFSLCERFAKVVTLSTQPFSGDIDTLVGRFYLGQGNGGMRVTPTAMVLTAKAYANDYYHGDFTATIESVYDDYIRVKYTKASHGILPTDHVEMVSYFVLDAEL